MPSRGHTRNTIHPYPSNLYFFLLCGRLAAGLACPSGIHSFSDVSAADLRAFFEPRVSGSRSSFSLVGRSSRSTMSLRRIVTVGFLAASSWAAAISSGVTYIRLLLESCWFWEGVGWLDSTCSPRRMRSASSGVMATLRTLVMNPGAPFPNPVLEGGRMYVWSTYRPTR